MPPRTAGVPPAPSPWPSRPAPGPVSSAGSRLGARTLDLVLVAAVAIVVLIAVPLPDRPFAKLALAATVFWTYETVSVATFGATLGKRLTGLRIVSLDAATPRLAWATAARRAAASTALVSVPVIGWMVWATSALGDPLRRGTPDRAAATMVTPKESRLPIATRDLAGYADGARPPRMTTLGRPGDTDVRVRARLRRLTDAPVLVGAAGLLALIAAITSVTAPIVVASLGLWLVLFVADETLALHRNTTTAGHHLAGLVVLDRTTGRAPSTGRAVARATALGLMVYVPLLWPLLIVSLLMMRWSDTGRGLHDVVGRTIVVADPALDPEAQRQQAMRVRLGQAG